MNLTVYDATNPDDLKRASEDVAHALDSAARASDENDVAIAAEIAPSPDLIGISDQVYNQINASLDSKPHIMFYGPPGTGKTQLAKYVASQLYGEHVIVTGSADWTSQDLIGGYMPVGEGRISFMPGLLLQNFDKPFIIDELNRCDIDKVLGPLFTVLGGEASTLPYLTVADDPTSARYTILPKYNPAARANEFSPSPHWRILATINSIDKASLYQMSYALVRRFAWILVDVPENLNAFVLEFCRRTRIAVPAAAETIPLATIWRGINGVRKIGAAPFIDVIAFCVASDPEFDFFVPATRERAETYASALSVFVLPMLDGIQVADAELCATTIQAALGLGEDSEAARMLRRRLTEIAI